jgi:Cytochrome c554 and c-prime
VACLVTSIGALRGLSQERGKPAARADRRPTERVPVYLGANVCAGCHKRDKPLDDPAMPPLCRCTENTIWEVRDKHRDAYEILTKGSPKGELAQRMGKLLGIEDVAKSRECLACHGGYFKDEKDSDKLVKPIDGVSCVVCHGPYEDWIDDHGSFVPRKRERWRNYSPEKKESEFGMTDLWNPSKRTKMCVSCHMGNAEDGKFVTHAMYAAGHPPLPGIETATFGDQMPRHWEYRREKTREVQKTLGFSTTHRYEQLQLVAVSSLETLRQSMNLLAAQAEKCTNAKDADDKALDLANFDCYACHHDLKSPSWRQQRGYVGKPGRPQMRPWPVSLAKVTAEEFLQKEQAAKALDSGLKGVYQAFSVQPFGNCPEIAAAARALASQLDQWIGELTKNQSLYDQSAALRVLRKLCATGEQDILDYDSARQIAWAFDVIYREWKGSEKDGDQRIAEIIGTLKRELQLDLPQKSARPEPTEKAPISRALPESLLKINEYHPDKFKKALQKISELLPAKATG